MEHDIAHIRKKDGIKQTVKEHVNQVANFGAFFGQKIGIANLAKLAGLLHDMGKAKEEFAEYIKMSINNPNDYSRRGQVDHATAGAKYLFEKYKTGTFTEQITVELVSMVIAFHHGGLGDFVNLEGRAPFSERMEKEAAEFHYEISVANFFQDCCHKEDIDELFQKSTQEVKQILEVIIKKIGSQSIQIAVSMLTKYLYSCLIDADRLDSFLFETQLPYQETKKEERMKLWGMLEERLETCLLAFPRETIVERVRADVSDQCYKFAEKPTGIYSLTVPTGGGKTLSSLRYAIHHAKKYGKEHIIYIVPFLTIIDQNVKDIKEALELDDDIILEQHCNVVRDNENEEFKLLTERWEAPIIFTSMVQFLETFYASGTQKVRKLHQFAQSVVIFDEVQAVPTNCTHLFNTAVNFLANVCSTTILLCTATQPTLEQTRRPLLKNSQGEMIENPLQLFEELKRVNLVDARRPEGFTITQLGDFAFEKALAEQNLLVILNTKSEAKNLYLNLKEKNELSKDDQKFTIFYLSTNLCAKHRLKEIAEIKRVLKNKERVICVSTQLIEAGVNISFHCVIRALAGLDSIAQAAGRCNRHGEDSLKNVYIINIQNETLGSLQEMKEGQANCTRVLEEYKANPENFAHDRLSPQLMERYFRYFYEKQASQLDYPYSKNKNQYANISVMILLNKNKFGTDVYRSRIGKDPLTILHQAFKTAAEDFEVIPDQTTSVIVPYEEGKDLIEKINGDCELQEQYQLLKKAQRYSVNLFKNELEQIGNGVFLLNGGVALALQPHYYDEVLGVIPEGRVMDNLMI